MKYYIIERRRQKASIGTFRRTIRNAGITFMSQRLKQTQTAKKTARITISLSKSNEKGGGAECPASYSLRMIPSYKRGLMICSVVMASSSTDSTEAISFPCTVRMKSLSPDTATTSL